MEMFDERFVHKWELLSFDNVGRDRMRKAVDFCQWNRYLSIMLYLVS